MTSRAEDSATIVSQETAEVLTQVHREAVDIGRMSGESLAEFARLHGPFDDDDDDATRLDSQDGNISIAATQPATQPVNEDVVDEPMRPPPPKKRKRMTFANKKLCAGRELFLKAEYVNQVTDDSVRVYGKIMKCATKKDRHSKYIVSWKKPYPQGINAQWLRTEHANTDNEREKLQVAIHEHESKHPSTGRGRGGSQGTKNAPRPIIPPPHPSTIAAASVRTSSSTVSSLSHGTQSTGRNSARNTNTINTALSRRSTRSSTDYESDSNDEYDDLEENPEETADPSELFENLRQEETEDDTDGNPESTLYQSIKQMQFNFKEAAPGNASDSVLSEGPCEYNGPTGLKIGIAEQFTDPLECLAVNGLDRRFIARLARNSNEHARKFTLPKDRNRRLHSHEWKNITVAEMHAFLGITLRISLSPMDSGGYSAYFRKENKHVCGELIYGTKGFAHKYMKFWRCKQIRAALHPDDRKAASMDGSDKAFMLRHALNTLNTAAGNVMHVSKDLTFDEGGTASRHRRNPIRQFNGAKPQKFRIDCFLLSEAHNYFIHHADVYQGKNASEVNMHREARGMPTTQKVVLNAVLQTRMHQCADGARHLVMDNRYQCPQLASLLLKRYDINSTGTSRLGRVGWDKAIFNIKKSRPKRTMKIALDEVNGALCAQWVDSKVVQACTSILNAKVGEVFRQRGSTREPIPCPEAIIMCQKNMCGVDKGDQIRAHGGGFSSKAHCKKWYKKGFFAILDMMLMNSLISWNVAANDNPQLELPVLSRHNMCWHIGQRMLNYTEAAPLCRSPEKLQAGSAYARGHKPEKCGPKSACAVCKIDWNLERKKLGREPRGGAYK